MNLQDTLNNKEILNNKENITILTKEIVDNFFNKNPYAKTFIIPDSVTKINFYAFNDCKSLKEITIPDSVTEIGNSAFDGCENLKGITIPDSVTKIGIDAFYGCESLKDITIPKSVTEIGNGAFYGCTNLKEIIFQNPPSLNQMKLGENAFSGCDLENINITFLDNELDKDDITNSIGDTKKDEKERAINKKSRKGGNYE